MIPWGETTAIATAYGGGSEYATVSRFLSDGAGGVFVAVHCYDRNHLPVDTRFTLTYLTSQIALR